MTQMPAKRKTMIRSTAILAFFGILVVAAMFLSVAFRYDGDISARLLQRLSPYFYYALLIFTACFVLLNLQTMPWRHTDTRMTIRIMLACIAGTAGMLLLGWIFQWRILRSILCLTGIFCCVLIVGARLAWSNFRRRMLRESDLQQRRVLIVGSGELGKRAYQRCLQGEMPIKGVRHTPVAFVDDDLDVVFRNVCGIPVEGGYADIPRIIEAKDIHEIILAVSRGAPALLGHIIQLCMDSGRDIPTFIIAEQEGEREEDNPDGKWRIRSLVISDLLFDETPVQGDEGIREVLEGHTVMVTGGAGSMGSELCRQIMRYDPAQIVVLDVNENYLFQLFDEATDAIREKLILIADSVADHERMEAVFARYQPQVVFHAAGYKNRLIAENCAEAAVRNNILGTNNILEAAQRVGAKIFVHLSADQAREAKTPIGVIKRIEEMSVQAHAGARMRCVSVRFGNTLGTYGGLVSRVHEQIDHGGPVKIYDPDSQRSFISVQTAARGILEAASDGWAKKDAYRLYTLDMGWPIQIRYLAEMLIRLRGYEPGKDIVIQRPDGPIQAENARGNAESGPASLMGEVKRDQIVRASFEPVDAAQLRADLERLRLILPDLSGEGIFRMLQDIVGDAGVDSQGTEYAPAAPALEPRLQALATSAVGS